MKIKKISPTFLTFLAGSATTFLLIISIFGSSVFILSRGDNWNKFLELLNLHDSVTGSLSQTQTILNEESSIIDVVSNASSAVVSIAVEQVEFSPVLGPQNSEDNIGTGFIVTAEGLIVTNQHVVSDQKATYSVTTQDKKTYDVTNIYRDEVNDIALVKIDTAGDELPFVELGDSDALKVGQMVVAIGTPLGDYPGSVTTGIVSGLERTVEIGSGFWSSSKEYEGVIQTDAAINPGNSGGPLLNSAGQAVGINFATTSGADNISFAIPINILKQRLDDFEARGGKFVKPYLGVSYQLVDEYDALRFRVPTGAFIEDLEEDGPAEKGGIRAGDIVVEMNGKDVSGGLQNVIMTFNPGESVEIKVWRKTGEDYSEGEYIDLNVELGEVEG